MMAGRSRTIRAASEAIAADKCLVSGSLRDLAQILGDRRKLIAVEPARHMSFCFVEFREEPLHELLAGRCEFNGDEAPVALAALRMGSLLAILAAK